MDIQITKSQLIKQKKKGSAVTILNLEKPLKQYGQPNMNSSLSSNPPPLPSTSKKLDNPGTPTSPNQYNLQNPNNTINQNFSFYPNESHIQNNKGNRSDFSEQAESSLKKENIKDISDFAQAWKLSTGFNIVVIEKLSKILKDYFKMRPELSKRFEEIEILVVYNKALLEILNKFEDHEKKIIHKLHVMEEFNVKIMRELCSLKNKQFKAPQLKIEESIFSKFSLKNFKYQPLPKEEYKLSEHDELKVWKIFKQHLLLPLKDSLPRIQAKKKQFQSREKSLMMEDNIQDLQELKKKISEYHEGIKDFNRQNMFDLFELKLNIKRQLGELQMGADYHLDKTEGYEEKLFVQEVMKIQAGLDDMQESELQNCLKKQQKKRKIIRKHRIKEQQVFIRMIQKVESQNIEHLKDISVKKHKINTLEDELNLLKAENEVKMMKNKSNNRSMLMSGIEQQMFDDEGKNKKMSTQTFQTMQKEIHRLNKSNQSYIEALAEYKRIEHNKNSSLKGIREHAMSKKIIIDQNWEEIKILHFLIQKLAQFAVQGEIVLSQVENNQFLNPSNNNANNLNDLPKSPSMKLSQSFSSAIIQNQDKFLLRTIKQTQNEDGELQIQMRNKEIQKFQKQAEQLQKKNQESKKLIEKLNSSLKDLETDIKLKNGKINQLVKQYERFQVLIKQLRIQNQSLRLKYYCSERLNQKMIHLIEKIQREDLKSDKDIRIIDSLFAKFHQLIEQYNIQIQSSEKQYQINRQINIQMDGGFRDEISLNNKNNGEDNISVASLKNGIHKKKERRESDLLSVKDYKEDDSKVLKQSVLRKIKSYNSLNIQNELQKQLLIERKAFSPKRLEIRAKHELEKQPDISENLHSNNENFKKLLSEKKSQTQVGHVQVHKKISLSPQPKINIKPQKNNISKQKQEDKSASSLGQKVKMTPKSPSQKEETSPKQMQNILQFLNIKDQEKKQQNMKEKSFLKQSPQINEQSKNNKTKIQQSIQKESKVKITNQISKNDKQKTQQSELKKKLKKKMEKMEQEYLEKERKNKQKQQKTPEISKKQERPVLVEDKQPSSGTEAKKQKVEKKQQTSVNSQKTIRKEIQNLFLDALDLKDEQKGNKSNEKKEEIGIEQNSDKNGLQVSQQKQIYLLTSQRQSQNLQSSNRISINVNTVERHNEIENFNLTYSSKNTQMPQFPSNLNNRYENEPNSKQKEIMSQKENKFTDHGDSKGIKKKVNHENSFKNLDNHLRDTYGIQIQNHEKIMEIIKKLSDFEDALDFAQLYARYKQALKCLDIAQATNRMYEISYQTFREELESRQKTENYSQQKELFYLRTLVEQQQKRIQEDDIKFNESLKMHIKTSQEIINLQLKNLRQEHKKNSKPEPRVIFF